MNELSLKRRPIMSVLPRPSSDEISRFLRAQCVAVHDHQFRVQNLIRFETALFEITPNTLSKEHCFGAFSWNTSHANLGRECIKNRTNQEIPRRCHISLHDVRPETVDNR